VLKQLTEKPVPSAVARVAEYAVAESNVDLVVHAVRVFRSAKGGDAQQVLLKLTDHESWRVRAEAVEALHEITRSSPNRRAADSQVNTALMKLLKDKDGFVVSRAAMMVMETNPSASLEAVIKAVEEHPELAADVLDKIAKSSEMKARAPPHLIKLAASPDAAVRAAAVKGLAGDAQAAGDHIAKALRDADERVRIAGAEATFEAMEELRPEDGIVRKMKRGLLSLGTPRESVERVDTSTWLIDFRAGKNRPAWLAAAAGDLDKILDSESERERLTAAQTLVALGKEERALPMLMAAATRGEQWKKSAASVLPWLLIDKRLEVFAQLLAMAQDDGHRQTLVGALSHMPDPRVRAPLWQLLWTKDVSGELADSVHDALLRLYLTEQYYNIQEVPKAIVSEAIAETRKRAESGPDAQRAVALAILVTASSQDAAEVAGTIYRDAATSDLLREDALLILLRTSGDPEAAKLAGEAFTSKHESMRALALSHLTGDADRLGTMRLGPQLSYSFSHVYFNQQTTPNLTPPAGITEAMLRPFLKTGGKQAAQAGYLLALLGKADAMDLLISHWRGEGSGDGEWSRLVFRAVAALNDEKYVPALEEIYSKMNKQSYQMREFYWTIRSMTGARVLALRKKIRDEVGMDNLR
jgi:HEAT repeat protein